MRKFLLFLFCVSAPFLSYSQQWKKTRQEVIFGLGAANILGDLGGADQVGTHLMRDLEISMTRPLIQSGYRYKLSPTMAVRGNLTWFRLAGNDQLTNEPARNNRNLSFRSDFWELSAYYEYSIIEEKIKGRYAKRGKKVPLNLYVFGGVSSFYFNPKGQLNGRWYALHPLGTEGQGLPGGAKPYSRVQIAIPLGIGVKYPINKEFSVGLEYSMRKTFTDYLDDVSTNYYDKEAIRASRGDIAAYFADPTEDKIKGGTNPGEKRGDPAYKDSFLHVSFYASYKLTGVSKSRVKF
jgi:hypothetical protein